MCSFKIPRQCSLDLLRFDPGNEAHKPETPFGLPCSAIPSLAGGVGTSRVLNLDQNPRNEDFPLGMSCRVVEGHREGMRTPHAPLAQP